MRNHPNLSPASDYKYYGFPRGWLEHRGFGPSVQLTEVTVAADITPDRNRADPMKALYDIHNGKVEGIKSS